MRELTHLSLFSGIGGLDLAAEWAGFRTVGQCERAGYPHAILSKHWPDVPKWRDIKTLTKEDFLERTGLHTVDIISGGFPCQPFSTAGKQRGKDDDRYLWPEMLRVIRELQPTWVLGENVLGIVNLALDQVLADLEAEGYESQCFIVPACGVDAPHKRYRVIIMAYCHNDGTRKDEVFTRREAFNNGILRKIWDSNLESGICRVDDGIRASIYESDTDPYSIGSVWGESEEDIPRKFTYCSSREREREEDQGRKVEQFSGGHSVWQDWPIEPGVGRVANGVPNRVDRIKCLGNAVVPQQFYPFFKAIADLEESNEDKNH